MIDLENKVISLLKKIIPGTTVSYVKDNRTQYPKPVKRGQAPNYKVPKTPKVSGGGWGY